MRIIRSDIYENLKMALSTLRANKLRSFLTVFGVVIGIITVMLIASFISGIDVSVKNEVESFGTRSIYISKFDPGIHIGRMSREERMRKELTYDDAIALATLPAVELSVPFLDITNNWFGGKLMVSGGGKTSAQVALQGTLPDFEKAGTQVIDEGRFFTQTENDTNQEVCVVGSKVADDFFKLGGHSLLATKVATRLREAFQQEISLGKMFEAPTVAEIAAAIEEGQARPKSINDLEIERLPRGNADMAQVLAELANLSEHEAQSLLMTEPQANSAAK